MNALEARKIADRKRVKKGCNKLGRFTRKVQRRADQGAYWVIGFAGGELRADLKSEGFKVYSILGLTLITW